MSRMLSGHPETLQLTPPPALTGTWAMASSFTNTAHAGAWGISYTMNLTPDRNTGLGIWTEEMFVKAIRTGRHMGVSRPINPPMPWPVYRNMECDHLGHIRDAESRTACLSSTRTLERSIQLVGPRWMMPRRGCICPCHR